MSDDFVVSTLIANHPDPATAFRALAMAEAAVLRHAADALNALPQDFERDPGWGDAAERLRRTADGIKEKSSRPAADATPSELSRLRVFADATERRHIEIRQLLASVQLTQRPDAWDLGMAIIAILDSPPARMPKTAERRALLLAAVKAEGGDWTTGRVKQTYRRLGLGHVYRGTYRRDLAALVRDGHLAAHDSPGRRFYTGTADGDS